MASQQGKGNGKLSVPEGDRVQITATGEFVVVACDPDTGRTVRVLGPSHQGDRRLDFMSGGEPLRVVCDNPKTEWLVSHKSLSERSEYVDPIPKVAHTPLKPPPSIRDLIREEFLRLRSMREDAGADPDDLEELLDFEYDDERDWDDALSPYEIEEMPFDDEIIVEDPYHGNQSEDHQEGAVGREGSRQPGNGLGAAQDGGQPPPGVGEGGVLPASGPSQSGDPEGPAPKTAAPEPNPGASRSGVRRSRRR